jgi:hypothetical protein
MNFLEKVKSFLEKVERWLDGFMLLRRYTRTDSVRCICIMFVNLMVDAALWFIL